METIKAVWEKFMPYILCILVGLLLGGWVVYDHLKPDINAANAEIAALKQEYATAIEEKEAAKIEAALAAQKEPEKVYIQGEDKIEYVYVEKESPDDPDVDITSTGQEIKISYNGEIYDLPMQRTTTTTGVVDGTLKIGQSSTATLDITDVVNREIANTILQKDAEIAKLENDKKVLERQKTQQTVWGSIIGFSAGFVAGKD